VDSYRQREDKSHIPERCEPNTFSGSGYREAIMSDSNEEAKNRRAPMAAF
jgi:hypothetical protein